MPHGGGIVGDRACAILIMLADVPGALSMLRLSKASVQEEAPPKREPQRRGSTGSIGVASGSPGHLSRKASFVM